MKKWYESRTFWVAVVEVAGGIIGVIFDGLDSGISWLAISAGIVMLILRKVTSQPIG